MVIWQAAKYFHKFVLCKFVVIFTFIRGETSTNWMNFIIFGSKKILNLGQIRMFITFLLFTDWLNLVIYHKSWETSYSYLFRQVFGRQCILWFVAFLLSRCWLLFMHILNIMNAEIKILVIVMINVFSVCGYSIVCV